MNTGNIITYPTLYVPIILNLLLIIYLKHKKLSNSIIIFAVFFTISTLSFRTRSINSIQTDIAIDQQVTLQILFLLISSIYVIFNTLLNYKKIKTIALTPPLNWIFLFCLLALFSATYSPHKTYTTASAAQMLNLFAILCIILNSDLKATELLNILFILFLGVQISIYILHIIDSEIAFSILNNEKKRLGGVLVHPNTLGTIATVTASISLTKVSHKLQKKSNLLYLFIFFTSIVTIYLTESRTSLITLLVILLIYLYTIRKTIIQLLILIFILITILIIFIIYPDILQTTYLWFDRDFVNLTGRTYVWNYILEQIRYNILIFLFGSGHATSKFELLNNIGSWGHAHNLYIETLYTMGIFGLSLLLISLYSCLKTITQEIRRNSEYSKVAFQLLLIYIIFIISSMTTSSIGAKFNIYHYLYFTLTATTLKIKK